MFSSQILFTYNGFILWSEIHSKLHTHTHTNNIPGLIPIKGITPLTKRLTAVQPRSNYTVGPGAKKPRLPYVPCLYTRQADLRENL